MTCWAKEGNKDENVGCFNVFDRADKTPRNGFRSDMTQLEDFEISVIDDIVLWLFLKGIALLTWNAIV